MAKRRANPKSRVSETEYQRFAAQFVELLVDLKRSWFVRYIVMGGLDHIPTDEEIDSGDFALRVLRHLKRGETEMIEVSLYEALSTGDREILVPYTRQWAKEAAFSREDLRTLLKMGNSSSLQRSFKKLHLEFDFRPGGQIKISRAKYDKLLKRSEQLRPVIKKILDERASGTSNSLGEILEYCQKDHPGACKFLSLHLLHFQQAFNDKHVIRRAKKRISARAGVLADAMAGTEYGVTFSTSIATVGEARRAARRQKPPLDSPEISD